jgi:hypothetical protein
VKFTKTGGVEVKLEKLDASQDDPKPYLRIVPQPK